MTEILLKVALNTITLTLLILFKSSCNFESDINHHSSNHYQLIKIGGVILVLRDQAPPPLSEMMESCKDFPYLS
jgi:hypothetical protein